MMRVVEIINPLALKGVGASVVVVVGIITDVEGVGSKVEVKVSVVVGIKTVVVSLRMKNSLKESECF